MINRGNCEDKIVKFLQKWGSHIFSPSSLSLFCDISFLVVVFQDKSPLVSEPSGFFSSNGLVHFWYC